MKKTNDENYCTMYIVRHGQSHGNFPVDVFGLDKNLTEKGKEQAKEIAKKLEKIKFDMIFASPLVRAQETAAIIAEEHKVEILTKEAIRERFSGVLEGRASEEVLRELSHLVEMRETVPYDEWKKISMAEGRETDEQIMSRFITALREVAVAYPKKTVLIVGHAGLMRTFIVHLGLASYGELKQKGFENTGYIKLQSDGVDFLVDELEGINVTLQ